MSKAGANVLRAGGAVEVAVLGLIALLLMAGGVRLLLGARQTPAQRERRRRLVVNRTGRMGDATIIDVREGVLYHDYQVRGVCYTTSQDTSDFQDVLPPDLSVLIGPAGLKYSPGNPANSIVICEGWSGLRPAVPRFEERHLKEKNLT